MLLKDRIIEAYREELSKRRRQNQVEEKMKAKTVLPNAEKLAEKLVKWNLEYDVQNFIASQFFALDYMPYLPTMVHIASDKSLERYNKVRHFFKKKEGREKTKKAIKRIAKKKIDKEYYLGLKELSLWEEKDKEQNFNTLSGFMACLSTTSLYNPQSNLCSVCKFRKKCRAKLKTENMNLYKFRKGLITETTYLNNIRKQK